jgi:hypothetical protein
MSKYWVFLVILSLAISCRVDPYSNLCDCGIFNRKSLIVIKNEYEEGFHGDNFIVQGFKYSSMEDGAIESMKKNGFVQRNLVSIPAISEVDSLMPYDSLQLCRVKIDEKTIEACIVDTLKKIIVSFQVSQ